MPRKYRKIPSKLYEIDGPVSRKVKTTTKKTVTIIDLVPKKDIQSAEIARSKYGLTVTVRVFNNHPHGQVLNVECQDKYGSAWDWSNNCPLAITATKGLSRTEKSNWLKMVNSPGFLGSK